jgi:hypothetical protein
MLEFINKFVIKDTRSGLFLNRRTLYGYNNFNQSLFQIRFLKSVDNAKKFSSYEEASRFLDTLPPTEFVINVPIAEDKSPVKFVNLVIEKVTFIL